MYKKTDLLDAVLSDNTAQVRALCATEHKESFSKFDSNGRSILYAALRKSVEMVEIIASEFPGLIQTHNQDGATPLEVSTRPLIKQGSEKMKILIQYCQDDVLNFGFINRRNSQEYDIFVELVDGVCPQGKEICFEVSEHAFMEPAQPADHALFPIPDHTIVAGA